MTKRAARQPAAQALAPFSEPTRVWFEETFAQPTPAQVAAWPSVAAGKSTLLVAPTGSGKTLAAFLAAIDRLLFTEPADARSRCQLIYLSPIKALAFDVERNLRGPLAGIARTADRLGIPRRSLDIAVRTGDTPSDERARFRRRSADILITTPESLFLLLTSQARENLGGVRTLIVDEIHAVAGTKRGTHLLLSLERLEAACEAPVQRIGLSATQRPLDRIARWLGGHAPDPTAADGAFSPRPVVIADAHAPRPLELTIEVPVDDLGDLASERPLAPVDGEDETAAPRTIWSAVHPRLLSLVRAHRSTMVFVNNRRLAERLAAAINELAGEPLARAHHGSVAREERVEIEDALKRGDLPCIIATSSLELGLDIGSVEMVVQIEAPPSVSSGIQRIGRANHQVGEHPRGTLFPKHRGDLLACAEAVHRMLKGDVERTEYPENALDVLAQQAVAIVASGQADTVNDLFALVRRATPYRELSRGLLEGVLDMLSGRYPSDAFAELRPRLTWDRESGRLTARKGAQRLAISNAGVIPDRGLYGVFLADSEQKSRRVGELDEEMVFEAREGEVFVLGASSWRIEEITHDRVLVSPAPGETGKMPFWRGDGLGRSAELGRGMGALVRALQRLDDAEAEQLLCSPAYRLEPRAAGNLIRFVREQSEPPYEAPTDRRLVVETFIDEVGDYRVCLLSPFGTRVNAPLAMCLIEKARAELGVEVEAVWMNDGAVLRFPEQDEPPDLAALLPDSSEVESLLTQALSSTALFAAHFRECAARALLLPRRHPTRRAPLWAQRRRAASLLQVASQFPSFPIVLETYRECLKDVFDVPALCALMDEVARMQVRVTPVRSDRPSPFASTLLFNYVGNFIYDADAPLSERRAAALSIDTSQLRELLGQADLKELLDPGAIDAVASTIARADYPPRDADELHDLLLLLGDFTEPELNRRVGEEVAIALTTTLERARRAVRVKVAGEPRWIAVEDAARYRDALGAMPPPGLPSALLSPVATPLRDLVSRHARTHVPFTLDELRVRYPVAPAELEAVLDTMVSEGRMLRGELHPDKQGITYCDVEVMRAIKRRSIAELRKTIEPVDTLTHARFLLAHHGLDGARRGRGGLHEALEQLQGLSLPLSDLEHQILPDRIAGFSPADLDQMMASGELIWRGMEPSQSDGGRVALYFREDFALLAPPSAQAEGHHVAEIRALLQARGAVFFHELQEQTGAFAPELLHDLWQLVWSGEVTNDTLIPLRSLSRKPSSSGGRRSARAALPGTEGRWTLLAPIAGDETARRSALVHGLLQRHGVLVRESLKQEGVLGGFSAAYEVLKTMEDLGKVRRGYFVAGLGAAQFALPGVEERLRSHRDARGEAAEARRARILAATDPASPWGTIHAWPAAPGQRPARAAGARVVVGPDGALLAWVGRGGRAVLTFFGGDASRTSSDAAALTAKALASALGRVRAGRLIATIDGGAPERTELGRALLEHGFAPTSRGLVLRKPVGQGASTRAEQRARG